MTIKIKPSHRGELHRELHVPQGQKIPDSKLQSALHSKSPHVRAQAVFAANAKHWKHK